MMKNVSGFLEHCRMPSVVTGSFFNLKDVELPLAGITGFNEWFERAGKRSSWFCGEIISPTYIGNNGCAAHSHIEGIATDEGELHFLEQVCDFIAHEGNSFEYILKVKDPTKTPIQFEGEVVARMNHNHFQPISAGKAVLVLNPFWHARSDIGGTSRNHSLRYNNRHVQTNGVYIPQFWEEFLGQIEEKGYTHPYFAITDKLKKERGEN